MIRSYLLAAIRHPRRNRLLCLIDVAGLAVGLSCCRLVMAYMSFELGYDRQHPHADRTYRMLREEKQVDGESRFRPETSGAAVRAIEREIPDTEETVRVFSHRVAFHPGKCVRLDGPFFDKRENDDGTDRRT